jgi:hypothetical protein
MPNPFTACLATLLVTLGSSCLGGGNSVNAYAGTRSLDTDDFDSLDDQTAYGLDAVLKLNLPLLATEVGWLHAEEDASSSGTLTDPELATDEYFVGLRFVPWDFLIAPYASAGVTYVDNSLDATGVSDDDSSIGYYARIGAAFSIGIFRIGADLRALFGTDVNLDTIESDVNSYQATAFVGLGF